MPTGADRPTALDTSVAIPLLVRTHTAHDTVVRWWRRRPVALCGHALIETYSVLTRLPGDLRLTPEDAAGLLAARFEAPVVLRPSDAARVPEIMADLAISGGAVYDAVIAMAAKSHRRQLATRDARAKLTYEAVGVDVVTVA